MIALASDHAGAELLEQIKAHLDDLGLKYKHFGTFGTQRCNYAEYGLLASKAVASGECTKGIVCCGTGVGISIVANKVCGIRCVVCTEPFSARLSRAHNDTNILALGGRVIGSELAKMIVDEWLNTEYEGGIHAERVANISNIEKTQNI